MTSRFITVPVLIALLAVPALAMFEDEGSSVRAAGMAGAFCAVADDVSAVAYNPAGLPQLGGHQFQGFYRLLFGGAGCNLHTGFASFGMPAGRAGVIAVSLQETGFELHSERTLRLSHGLVLAEGIAFGYALNGYNLYQRGVGLEPVDVNGFAFGLDLAMHGRIYRAWTVGLRIRNINAPRIGSGPQGELPQSVTFGLAFSPVPGIRSSLDATKEPGQSTQLRIGQELRIIRDHLVVRAGVQTVPVRLAVGLRTGTSNIHLDYAVRTHAELPWTHDLGLTVDF